jgi:hypothetical protein
VRQIPVILKISKLPEIRFDTGNPEHGVIISQPALPFFEVGFKQISGISEIPVPLAIIFYKRGDYFV